jgi:hypothetical protein
MVPACPAAACQPAQQVLDLCSSSSDCYISYDWNSRLKYAFIFHFFGLLWTNQFIVGLSSVVVAGAVANFYWSRGDSRRSGRAQRALVHAAGPDSAHDQRPVTAQMSTCMPGLAPQCGAGGTRWLTGS